MFTYELMYIVSPEVEEEDLEAVVDRISQMITDGGGQILHLESWGRRRLAYQIRRFREGHYILVYFQLEPGAISQLRARLALAEEVIRYLLLRTEGVPDQVADTAPQEEPAPTEEPEAQPEAEPVEEAVAEAEEEPAGPEPTEEQDTPDVDNTERGE